MKKNGFVYRKIHIGFMIALLAFVSILLVSDGMFKTSQRFKYNANSYTTMQYEISDYAGAKNQNQLAMSDVYDRNGNEYTKKSDVQITENHQLMISTAEELYAFSYLASIDDDFLTYSYQLNCNIDYTIESEFIPIAYQKGKTFSGTFNGNGFEISNLDLLKIRSGDGGNYSMFKDAGTAYYAMFCYNSGTIQNLGLIDTNIVINVSNTDVELTAVAPLVGVNTGEIRYTYAKDLRDPIEEEAGITAIGGYQISGLVFENDNIFTDSYTAYSIISNHTVDDYIDFHEICSVATSTGADKMNNLAYYNGTIESVVVNNGTETVEYDMYLVGKDAVRNSSASEWKSSLSDLNTYYEAQNQGWFTSNSYKENNVKSAVNITTPILRGLENPEAHTFNIHSIRDFVYMFELMNQNSLFASNDFKYIITTDLDLSILPRECYSYSSAFSAAIEGNVDSSRQTILDVNGGYSSYPTIYNASITNSVITEGIECFGFIPWLSGSISNLNFYYDTPIDSLSANSDVDARAIGLVSGLIDGGTISCVNAYGVLDFSSNSGKYYAGGIAGISTDRGNIIDVTASGSITGRSGTETYTDPSLSGYVEGNAIGGILGYATRSSGDLATLLTSVEITLDSFNQTTTLSQAAGGILGAGYTAGCYELYSKGNIIVPAQSGEVYAAGCIGRHLGMSSQIRSLTNQGDIIFSNSTNTCYLSGVSNVDLVTTSTATLLPTILRNTSAKYAYWASGFTNASNFDIQVTNTNLKISGVSYIKNSNEFESEISGFYNVAYRELISSGTKTTEVLEQTIDMTRVHTYAPCIITDGSNLNAKTVYNLKNINFVTSGSITQSSLKYSGAILGKDMNLNDIRNEGTLSFTTSNTIGSSSSNLSTLQITGVFEEVSSGYTADLIYNGGDITLDFNANLYANLYVSGICHSNATSIANANDFASYNPISSSYHKEATGSLNTGSNQGSITQMDEATPIASYGNMRFAGICIFNESIISSAFNLGNISNSVRMQNASSTAECSGITWLMSGEYAQIKDSANNGIIKNINLRIGGTTSSSYGYVTSSGIVGRNDKSATGSNYTGGSNHLQYILYSVNYGEVIAYNKYTNQDLTTTYSDVHSIASGIIASGLCGMINTVNYGNVFGSEVSSGMLGVCDLAIFGNSLSSTSGVTIANSINYANVRALARIRSVVGVPTDVTYTELLTLDFSTAELDEDNIIKQAFAVDNEYAGSVISVINYNSNTNAQYIHIRYLINFNTVVSLVGQELSRPSSVVGATDTMFTARTNDSYLNSPIVYAPLSSIRDDNGNIGVFSTDFAFRRAIEGRMELDTETYPTDAFLADYFQFVAFSKVNDSLLDSIGWSTIAYLDAAENFSKDLTSLVALLKEYNQISSTQYSEILTSALNTSTWLSACDTSVLGDLLEEILEAQDTESLKNIIEYLFTTSSNKNSVTTEFRKGVINQLLMELDIANDKTQLIDLIESVMYSDLLANIIAESDDEKANIKQLIESYIEELDIAELMDLTYKYLEILETDTVYDVVFTSDAYSQDRIQLLTSLLDGFDENIYRDILTVVSQTGTQSERMQMQLAISSLTSDQVNSIYASILSQNTLSTVNDAVITILRKMDLLSYTEEVDTAVNDSFASSVTSVDEKVQLWNLIKNNPQVQTYLEYNLPIVYSADEVAYPGLYDLATEYKNSYQSNNSPSGSEFTYNPSTGLTTTVGGRLRATTDDEAQNTRYIYTPDEIVSDGHTDGGKEYAKTYFYGPYVNGDGNYMWNSAETGTKAGGAANKCYNLFDNTSDITTRRYVPVFISLDKDYLAEKVANTDRTTLYEFMWNDNSATRTSASTQWVSKDIIYGEKKDDNKYVLKKNTTTNTPTHVIEYGYDFTTADTVTSRYEFDNGIAYNNVINFATGWSEADVLFAYCSASIITGIYYTQNQWETHGAYLTAKKDDEAYGVVTTHYIDYSVSDLVNVDGYRTKGHSSGNADPTEQNIIARVIDILFETPQGKSLVNSILGSSIQTGGIQDTNLTLANKYMAALGNDSTFTLEFIQNVPYVSSAQTLAISLTYNGTTYTNVKDYLLAVYSGLDPGDIDRILLYSVDDKEKYNLVLQYLFNKKYGLYSYSENLESSIYRWLAAIYSDEINQLIIDYINNNSSLTEEQLQEILLNADQTSVSDYIAKVNEAVEYGSPVENVFYTFGSDLKINLDYQDPYYASISSINNSTITFTTPNDGNYIVYIDASGSGNLSCLTTSTLSDEITTHQFSLAGNTTYTIEVPANAKIYNIRLALSNEITYSVANSTPVTLTGTWDKSTSGSISTIDINATAAFTTSLEEPNNTSTVADTIGVTITGSTGSSGFGIYNGESLVGTYTFTSGTISISLQTNTLYTLKNTSSLSISSIVFSNTYTEKPTATGDSDVNYFSYYGIYEVNTSGYFLFDGSPDTSKYIQFKVPDGYNAKLIVNFASNAPYISQNDRSIFVSKNLSKVTGDAYPSNTDYTTSSYSGDRKDYTSVDLPSGDYYLSWTANVRFYSISYTITKTLDFVQAVEFDDSVIYPRQNTNNLVVTASSTSNESIYGVQLTGSVLNSSSGAQLNALVNGNNVGTIGLTNTTTTSEIFFNSPTEVMFQLADNYIYHIDGITSNSLTSNNIENDTLYSKYVEDMSNTYGVVFSNSVLTNEFEKYLASRLFTNTILYTEEGVFHLQASTALVGITLSNVVETTGNLILTHGSGTAYTLRCSNGLNLIRLPEGQYTITFSEGTATINSIMAISETAFDADVYNITTAVLDIQEQGITFKEYAEYTRRYEAFKDCTVTSTKADYQNIVSLLYAIHVSTDTTNTHPDVSLYEKLTEEQLVELIQYLSMYDLETLLSYIGHDYGVNMDSYLIWVIADMCQLDTNFLQDVMQQANLSLDTMSEELQYKFAAAYVGTNYLLNISMPQQSVLKEILNDFDESYQYINDDGSMDNTKFIALMTYLGFNLSTDGYGIYALSSSKGILNGQFIPDNFSLSSMDSVDGITYELVTGDISYYKLTTGSSSDWRGGSSSITATQGGVTDAFLNDMKQLKLSISTTIFELNLEGITSNGVEYIVYSSEELIDLDNHIITYYVPNVSTISADSKYTIYGYRIADAATLDTAFTSSEFTLNGNNIVRIVAEDATVYADYTIQIIQRDLDFNLVRTSEYEIPYTDGQVVLSVTPTSTSSLPQGFDLTPYIQILDASGNVMENSYILAATPIVDASGNATIVLNIETALPAGNYTVLISMFGSIEKTAEFSKLANEEANITLMEFDGNIVNFSGTNNIANNSILFGRCFNKADLIDITSSNFYLTRFEVSPNATINIDASLDLLDGSDYIYVYTITITIIAEDGIHTNVYTHVLTELDPIPSSGVYASVYKDGVVTPYVQEDYKLSVSFERGETPYYRFKYNLNNFYEAGDYSYSMVSYEGVVLEASYSGLSVSVTNDADAGLYEVSYVYTNNFVWDEEMTKEYVFPAVTVEKLYSTESHIQKLTFLNTASTASDLATIMYPNDAVTPLATDNANEKVYSELYGQNAEERLITVSFRDGINYKNSLDAMNYYAVGSISNAELNNYAPSIRIEEHAEIYQYTTLMKNQEYGIQDGYSQEKSDTEVLNSDENTELYLYVPYCVDGDENNIVIFLIKSNDGKWSEVYLSDFTSTGVTLTENKGNISYNGVNYTISESAGSMTANPSLYMDYIGTPLDNHFWYVSYVVFSENYLKSDTKTDLRFYHMALIDATNTIFFEFTFDTPTDFDMSSMYISILDNVYATDDTSSLVTISAFANKVDGVYALSNNLQVLPRGYFYFYLNLPEGYVCTYTVTNNRVNSNDKLVDEEGAYLPPASIVTQRVEIVFTIEKAETGITWGQATSQEYAIQATEVVKQS